MPQQHLGVGKGSLKGKAANLHGKAGRVTKKGTAERSTYTHVIMACDISSLLLRSYDS
jgi:hypothetical protein